LVAYELMFILNPELDQEAIDAAVERVESVIKEGGGVISKLDKWGKRRLAYEVKKFREGFYVLVKFKATPQTASEVERIIKINEHYIRYLLIRDEKAKDEIVKEKQEEEVKETQVETAQEG
jgi:small subunit ribosomal protein S6